MAWDPGLMQVGDRSQLDIFPLQLRETAANFHIVIANMQDCCRTGFLWNGEPAGREETIGSHKVYTTGTNTERGILFLHDAFGWQLGNNRLLADHFAKEIGATVYLPDL